MPLQRRIPKRGFRNPFRVTYEVINVQDLNAFAPNSEVDVEALVDAGLVKPDRRGIKLLGEGELSHPVRVRVHKASRTARDKVEAAGGAVELL
jgi:large subunit ribosomal protein L15